MLENDQGELVSIFNLIKTRSFLYSSLASGSRGPLFRNDLTIEQRYQIWRALIEYIESHYTTDCSTFTIADLRVNKPQNQALPESHFRVISQDGIDVPYIHVIPL